MRFGVIVISVVAMWTPCHRVPQVTKAENGYQFHEVMEFFILIFKKGGATSLNPVIIVSGFMNFDTLETRRLPQLRVTVNSRCGRACFFCRPSGEALSTRDGVEIDPAQLLVVLEACRALGLRTVKLTGGDPALWEPLTEVVRVAKEQLKFDQVEVISRHPKIGEIAQELKCSHVDILNISLDTLVPSTHKAVTGIDDHADVLGAIAACAEAGLAVKINTVVMKGVNDGELTSLIDYAQAIGAREIKLLDVISDLDLGNESFAKRLLRFGKGSLSELYMPLDEVVASLSPDAQHIEMATQGGLGHPMTVLTYPSGFRVVVKDHTAGAWYGSICDGCKFFPCHDALMALRITADMRIQFCLLREDISISLGDHLAGGVDAVSRIIEAALARYDDARFHKTPSPAALRTVAQTLRVIG